MKYFRFMLVVLILYPSVTIINAQTMPFYELKTETIDLKVDGSITPQTKTLTQNFTYVTRILIKLCFDDPDYVASKFGAGTALTNGTSIITHGSPLFDFNLTKNDQLSSMAYDTTIFQDDAVPKDTHVITRLSFFKLAPPLGLYIVNNESLYFVVQDDLTDAGLEIIDFQIIVEGFEEITVVEKTQATNWFGWLNEVWLSITTESMWLLIIFLCVIVLPFVAWRKLR